MGESSFQEKYLEVLYVLAIRGPFSYATVAGMCSCLFYHEVIQSCSVSISFETCQVSCYINFAHLTEKCFLSMNIVWQSYTSHGMFVCVQILDSIMCNVGGKVAGWFIVHFVQIRSSLFDPSLRSECHSVTLCCVARQHTPFCSHVVTLSIHVFVKSHALVLHNFISGFGWAYKQEGERGWVWGVYFIIIF